MQPQSSKNNYNGPQNTGNNITAQNRANQTSAGINFRQNISNLTPRNRYVPATTMFPSVHPSVVMGQFNATYATRPPALQYAPQYYPHIYYPYYQQLTQQQQQPQSGGGNPLASLNTVMAVQPGGFVSGPIQAANRAAMPFTVAPGNSVLNVATNNTAQAVGISTIQQTTTPLTFNLTSVSATPMLAATTTTTAQPAMGQNQTCLPFTTTVTNASIQRLAPAQVMTAEQKKPIQTKAKLRSHALQIIHPITNKNILQDLNKDSHKTPNTTMELNKLRTSASSTQIIDRKPTVSKSVEIMQNIKTTATKKIYKDATQQAEQKSIVSAMTHYSATAENSANTSNSPLGTVVNTKIDNSPKNLNAPNPEVLSNSGETLPQQAAPPQNQVIVQNEENKDIDLNTASSDNDIVIVDLPNTEERSENVAGEALKQEISETPAANENTANSHYTTNVTNEIKPLEMETENKDENYPTIVEDLDLQSELSIADVTENDEDIEISSQNDLENVPGDEPPFAMCSKNNESTTQVTFFNDTFQQSFSDFAEIHDASLSPTNRRQQYTRKQLMQLRQAKNSCIQPDVKNTCIFAPISLMPAFVTRCNKKLPATVSGHRGPCTSSNNQNKGKQNLVLNQGSVTTNPGAIGQSTATGSGNRVPNKPIIYLNLSLNQDVKLNEADNAWRPRVLVKASDTLNSNPEHQDAPEKHELLRRVRGILNKLTPENFEPLVEEIIKLKIDTLEKMEAVMNLVFEKAIDEPNFSVSYAKLCHRLISEVKARDERMESSTKSNLAFFRSALLDKTESEFTHNVIKINAKEEKLKPIRERLTVCQDYNEKIELEALLIEEERKIRRRSGGTVRFIGELFKISILSGKIINSCIEALLKYPNNEDMLECLCKLLTTVGQKFEQTPMFTDDKSSKYSLKTVIQRMQKIASKTGNSKISSRVRFMLLDVIDLRKKKWQSTRNEAPKTMEQIEKEGNASQQSTSTSNGTKRDDQKRQQGGGLQTQLTSQQTNYTATPNTNTVLDSNKPVKLDSHAANKRNERGRCAISADATYTQRDNMGAAKYTDGGKNSNDSKWQVQTGKVSCTQAVDTSKLVGLTKVDLNNKKMGGVSLFQWKKAYTPPAAGTPQQTSNSFEVLSLEANKGNKLEHDHDKMRSNSRLKTMQLNKIGNEHERYTHDQHNRQHPQALNKDNQRKPPILRGQQQMRTQKSPGNQTKYQQDMMNPSRNPPPKFLQLHKAPNVMGNSETKPYTTIITPPAIFIEPTEVHLKLIKPVVTEMLENAADTKHIDSSTVSCISKLPDNLRCSLIYYLLTDYLHLANVKSLQRRYLANIVGYLIEKRYITKEHFNMAYKKFAELANDLIVDIPQLWLYIFEFTGPLMVKHILSVNDLWSQELRESGPPDFGQKFLKSFLVYSTREIGPNFIRNTWHKYHMKWSDYMDEKQVEDFIKNNNFDYVENENKPPLSGDSDKEPPDIRNKRITSRLQQMLNEGANPDQIIDFINGNIKDINKPFIHNLTNTLTNFAIEDLNNYSLDVHCFQRICIPVLRRYLDSKDDLELECLRAIQLLIHDLDHPKDLLQTIYYELSDADVIAQETFLAWQDLKKQCEKCSTANL